MGWLQIRTLALFAILAIAYGSIMNFEEDLGATASSPSSAQENSRILGDALNSMKLDSVSTLVIPSGVFFLQGGIRADGLRNARMLIDGTLKFTEDITNWPMTGEMKGGRDQPRECIELHDLDNVTFTSSSSGRGQHDRGIIDGSGHVWWGIPLIGYLDIGTARPHLIYVKNAKDFVVENLVLKDSPRWTCVFHGLDNAVIRHSSIVARRTRFDGHNLIDLSAFNTDGFDVSGHDIHIHDCDIWNQDDSIAVKDDKEGSYNMLFERINASGTGLVIGSIAKTHVHNITFRDSYLHRSYKGLFLKFREGASNADKPGIIEDVRFENINIFAAEQWPIWIGPAQQAISGNPCNPQPCSLCWPLLPWFGGDVCDPIENAIYRNITLREIRITGPKTSLGTIIGSPETPIRDITFDNVVSGPCSSDGYSRVESFPGLLQPINDPEVVQFYIILGLTVVIPVLLVTCCCWFKWRCAPPWCKLATTAIFITVPPIVLMATIFPGFKGAIDTSDYYACEGVEGGVAKGGTNVVPRCFADRTEEGGGDVENCNSLVVPGIGVGYAVLTTTVLGFVGYKYIKTVMAPVEKLKGGGGEDAMELVVAY